MKKIFCALLVVFILFNFNSVSVKSDSNPCVKNEEFSIDLLDDDMNLAEAIEKYPVIKDIYYVGISEEELKDMGLDVVYEEKVIDGKTVNAKEFLSLLNARRSGYNNALEITNNNNYVYATTTSYGAAWSYVSNTSTTTNCYGYAIGYNAFIDPGDMYYASGITYNSTNTVNDVANNMIKDAKRSHLTARTITSATAAISSNEYRIVTRVGYHYISGVGYVWDYHWMRQTSTGTWAHKPGQTASANLGSINPSTYSWNLGSIYSNFYNSSCVYIATPKLAVCRY